MCQYVLNNAKLWIGDGSAFEGHVVVDGDTIKAVEQGHYNGDLPATDIDGLSLSPGLIDLMVLGGFGKSISRDDVVDIAREYLRLGVTSIQFCTASVGWDAARAVAQNVRQGLAYHKADAAGILGIFMEGPFMVPDLAGASHQQHTLPPSRENVQNVLDEFGDVLKLINISPGTEGDVEAICRFCEADKFVSMAHSNACAGRVKACIESGASILGHIWCNSGGRIGDSGMQQPTIEHVALTDERVRFIHMLGELVHVSPIMMKLVLRCRGVESIILVTDCHQQTGCEDGPFTWDDGRIFYKENSVCRTETGHLAGSAIVLPDMFRNFVKATQTAPHQAIRTVTLNPAASQGLDHRIGLLAPGRRADLVAWDSKLQIRRVWRAGQELSNVSGFAEVRM